MSRILQVQSTGLFTEALEYACPSSPTRLGAVMGKLGEWTEAPARGAVFSGYRRQVLAREGVAASKSLAEQLQAQFDTMVVLGIGGSALGAKTALSALKWKVPADRRRTVHVAENLDPIDFETIWSSLRPESTVFVVISKSGGTIETMSQLAVVLERLGQAGLSVAKHVVAITDPRSGKLRSWVDATGVRSLEVPSDVGGRFSVLTPVGLLPMAFAGLDVEAMVDAAARQFQGGEVDPENVARTAMRLAELEAAGFMGHVMMPYATVLRDFGDWFVQLWGESLGKIRAAGGRVGPMPIAALGATDQHSLLQLMVEGPNRLVTGFIRLDAWPVLGNRKPAVTKLPVEFASLSFATGHSFEEILNAEQEATARVLSDLGRPYYEMRLQRLDEAALGILFAVYMDMTGYAAAYHEVNPYDQPGVELGKRILPEILKP